MDDLVDDLPNEDEDDFDFFEDNLQLDAVPTAQGPGLVAREKRPRGEDGDGSDDDADAVPPPVDVAAHFPSCKTGTTPMVMGVIAVMDLAVGIDLLKLASAVHYSEYVLRRSPAVTLRIREPSCVALIRPTGVVVLIGAYSAAAARQAAELCARIIRHVLGLERLTVFKFAVRSMMARVDLKHPIKLDEIQRQHGDVASYEPEVFCGCIVKLHGTAGNQWSASASVFATGKVTIVGARSEMELQHAFNKLVPMISPFARREGGNKKN